MKKIILLSCLMLLSIMANAAYKIDGIYYNLDPSTKTAEVSSSSDFIYSGDITIPNEVNRGGVTYSVRGIGSSAFAYSNVTSVTIPNSVTYISSGAFRDGSSRLKSIVIPNSVKYIGDEAFYSCSGLVSVKIEDGEETVKTNQSNQFKDCPLETLYLGRNISGKESPFRGMSTLSSLTIGNSVTSISNYAFQGCSGLTSVTIPSSVTSISDYAFQGCSGLTSVTIPSSVTSIGSMTFEGCSNLTSVNIIVTDLTSFCNNNIAYYIGRCIKLIDSEGKEINNFSIPNGVTNIGGGAFSNCCGLTSVDIGNSVTTIGNYAFENCSGLTSLTIPENVTSIGISAFSGCSGLTSVKIKEGEGTLAFNTSYNSTPFSSCPLETLHMGRNISYSGHYSPFSGIKTLSSLTIGNSVTSIGDYVFLGCSGLTSVNIPNSVTSIGASAFEGCSGLTSVNIGNSVTTIRGSAFYGCSGLTSLIIPNNVMTIGGSAFQDCSSLTSVKIEDGEGTLAFNTSSSHMPFSSCPLETLYMGRNISFSFSPFRGIKTLSSLTIGNSVISIGDYAFLGCSGLTSLTIPESVTSIGDYAFSGCSGLTSLTIPESVTSIGSCAFYGCNSLESVSMSDNIISIGYNAFVSDCKLYVKKGSKTLLTFWNTVNNDGSLVYKPYEKKTDKEIMPPSFNITATQTTAKVEIENWSDGYTYTYNGEETTEKEFVYTKMKPASTHDLTLVVSKEDVQHVVTGSFTTKGLSPQIQFTSTASSISATGGYTEEDAKVVSHSIQIGNGEAVKGNQCFVSGLTPNMFYMVKYTIEVDYGGEETAVYSGTSSAWTANLKFDNAQPKIVSEGNVVVSSTCSNLDPAETTIGFEWRCTDWTDEFPSNRGSAFLYDGVLEGMIKNLNVNKLWKFRPYYVSASGKYTYGDWTGIDPTNTSYFEPTVRTYAKVSIEGNTAEVNGYTLKGTDEVTTTGFKYWKSKSGVSQRSAVAIPSDAITVITAGQQTMSAKLTELAYNAEYTYVAFATTADGSTYYGAEQSFITGEDPTSTDIESIEMEPSSTSTGEPVTIVARYNMNGQQISTPQKGVNILRYSDGSSKKVQVK